MSAAHLPASTELLGIFVEAFDARRYATGRKASALRDRTARRCFAGSVCTRRWCCPLTALLEYLREEKLIDGAPADELARNQGLFLCFAPAMMRWDSIVETQTAGLRAHLRVAAIELVVKLRFLTLVGFDFGIAKEETAPIHWLDPAARAEPLRALRTRAGDPSAVELAKALGFGEPSVGRWFTKGERPGREAMQVLATYFGKTLGEDRLSIYRSLYWHYALADVVRALARWVDERDAREIARVAAFSARCPGNGKPPDIPAAHVVAYSMMPLPVDVVVQKATAHGAGDDWSADAARVHADHQHAGTAHEEPEALLEFFFANLPRAPRRSRKRGTPDH